METRDIYIYIYVRLFLIRMRALVFCELNSRARKRNDFLASLANVSWTMLEASLERISIGLILIREYNIFLLGKLARLVMGTIF